MTSGKPNINEKVLQYESFINEVLKRDLQKVLEQRDGVYEKISQYLQLKNTIKRIQVDYILLSCHFCSYYLQISNRYLYLVQETGSKELKTDVDLGCSFFVQAHVPDTSKIFVAVGYGFFLELTLSEALTFIEKKTLQLTEYSEVLTKDAAKIKAHIRVVLEGLKELQGLNDLPETTRREVF
ncbi:protein UXT isoform X1 [Ictalurus punctatus]|uniref:Protein UXT isoform X1 n=1 Tax=Ictalurus punctatus TaxID=7998 RepID=A0A9F7R4J7_ICTPU|nr:protein UXT isoform X1 [Ictalurus punctatus]XP_053536394.1 protein UXT isoform X1 [Ictalurus punctatus]